MPVSTGSFGEPRAKRCKHCDESSHRSESGSGYWQLQLDRDLVDTISAIYPEWFKSNMAEGGQSTTPRESPPKVVVDSSPLLNSLEQNKESLKVKLMLRRPVEQLVAQGIMPPLKTPAAFHGQRRQLERAKTGDLLKTKIQQRPSRLELESRHILEADPHVDPSLAEKQRMLKKARLADQLNDQLSHRPGPLELIQKNILHTEETIEHAVKAGHIPYRATCEGQLNRPQHPLSYINPEDDSQSSEDNNPVSTTSPGPVDVLETAAKSAGIVVSLIPAQEGTVVVTTATPIISKDNSEIVFADLCRPHLHTQAQVQSPASLVSSTSTLSPLSSIASPVPSIVSQPATPAPPPMPSITLTPRPIQSPVAVSIRTDAPGKDKNRKKSKSKATPKTRTIKFHEYKGPPSAQKTISTNSGLPGESSYDLLLQQQTLLLQFQLQLQHKYPQIILPASQKQNSEAQPIQNNNNCLPPASPAPSTASDTPSSTTRIVGRLEDMKVSDLKAELKRRSLPVSGSKPQLIERLKSYSNSNLDMPPPSNSSIEDSHNSPQNTDCGSPQTQFSEDTDHMDIGDPMSPNPQLLQHILDQTQQKTQEEIVREQKRQIEELQRELMLSQLKLQAATKAEPKAQLLALQKHLQARQHQQQMVLQMQQLQALQARQAQTTTEEQQRIQQQQHVAFQNQKNLTGSLVLNSTDAAIVLNHLVQGKTKLINGHARANSLPNFINSIVTPVINPIIKTEIKAEFVNEEKPPPPLYEEATKQIKMYEEASKQIKKEKSHIKSQIVDDVLEILIKNGELPASAAQDPLTPNSATVRNVEAPPVFPITNDEITLNVEVIRNGDIIHNNDISHNVEIIQNGVDIDTNTESALELDTADILDTLDTLENMDFSQLMELGSNNQNNNNLNEQDSVPMDTDDWLESLLPSNESNHNCISSVMQDSDLGYDPLMGIAQDPFDPFCLEDFRSPSDLTAALSWDKVDFAA